MIRILTGIALVLIVASCHDVNKQKQLDQVSQLIKTVDSIQTVHRNTHSDSIPIVIFNVTDVELRIKRHYKTDTIDLALGKKMDEYKLIRKRLSPNGKTALKIEQGSKEEKEALERLRNDIETGAGDRSKYNEYIAFERNKVEQLNVLLKQMVGIQEQCMASYRKLHEEMDSFSRELLRKDTQNK